MAQSRRQLSIAKFDVVVLFLVVGDMVIKPAAANIVTLAGTAIMLIGSAEIFLRRQ